VKPTKNTSYKGLQKLLEFTFSLPAVFVLSLVVVKIGSLLISDLFEVLKTGMSFEHYLYIAVASVVCVIYSAFYACSCFSRKEQDDSEC
tara:strand:+ start:32643 stop:32909 length:267 start_codon:yes stop_codon:yes gene_type:complete